MHPTSPLARLLVLLLVTLAFSCSPSKPKSASSLPAIPATRPTAGGDEPPPAPREFRAAWVATVGNIDWPTKPGLSTAEQQREVIQILDRAAEINLNAIILQVRTTADALYDSKYEPWSYYLTGKQGKAPDPYYDPLKFWIDEAHKRGIELHAWFNPFRTYVSSSIERSNTHITKSHPELARDYGKMGWMDPGDPAAREHSFNVFMDVVDRYDVDGIHIDDYFYPYPEPLNPDDKNDKREKPFPDDNTFGRYVAQGGKLLRNDWRRDNINQLIHRIYDGIRKRKPHVKFGISPFGIPRPGLDGIEYVKGFDQYDKLYADTVMWLQKGWCDYFVPQLYWKTGAMSQPYLGLLRWWAQNNPKARNIYGGLFLTRIDWGETSWSPDEILGQIMITRLTPGAHGNVHFSMIGLTQNRKKIAELLRDGLYAQPALVPPSHWLDSKPPVAPRRVMVERIAADAMPPPPSTAPATKPATTKPFVSLDPPTTKPIPVVPGAKITWSPSSGEKAFVWAVYYKQGSAWKLKVVPGDEIETTIADDATAGPATVVAVSAVDRCGNESKRTRIQTGLTK